MVSVLSPSVVYHGFEPGSRQTKNYDIGMRCFSANHAAWTRKSEDWMVRNKNNVLDKKRCVYLLSVLV
jgi:hypothetical protein